MQQSLENMYLLIAKQRSGTQLFTSLLSQQNSIRVTGELFHRNHEGRPRFYFEKRQEYLKADINLALPSPENQRHLFREYFSFIKGDVMANPNNALFVDVKYSSCHHFNTYWQSPLERPYMAELAQKLGFGVVHLIRENVLANYASSLLARVNGNWSATDTERKVKVVEVPTEGLIAELDHRMAEIDFYRQAFRDCRTYEEIAYETMLSEDNVLSVDAADKVAAVIGRPVRYDLSPGTKKIAAPLRALISNVDAVEACLRGTPYAAMLD